MRKSSVEIVELCMFASMQLDTECEKQKEHKCSNCNFCTKSKEEMNYHTVKKHAQHSLKQSAVDSSCEQEFPSYYSLQQHRRKEHGAKQRKLSDTVADLNRIVEEEGDDGKKLRRNLVPVKVSGGYRDEKWEI